MYANFPEKPLQPIESYVVRRWRVGQEGWRYAVQRIPDGAWLGFASAADLFDYLNGVGSASSDEARLPED